MTFSSETDTGRINRRVALGMLTTIVPALNERSLRPATERRTGPKWQYGYLFKLRGMESYSFVTVGGKSTSGKTP